MSCCQGGTDLASVCWYHLNLISMLDFKAFNRKYQCSPRGVLAGRCAPISENCALLWCPAPWYIGRAPCLCLPTTAQLSPPTLCPFSSVTPFSLWCIIFYLSSCGWGDNLTLRYNSFTPLRLSPNSAHPLWDLWRFEVIVLQRSKYWMC